MLRQQPLVAIIILAIILTPTIQVIPIILVTIQDGVIMEAWVIGVAVVGMAAGMAAVGTAIGDKKAKLNLT